MRSLISKEVLVPDDNKSNRGDRDFENRRSSGRESDFSSSSNERERDSKGRFESDDSENESSSSRSGSNMGSSGQPQKKK
jgi:hypothetical protein